MAFELTRKLSVTRTLSSGERVSVGVLAQNRQGVFFQYEAGYLEQFGNLSPFLLRADAQIQMAPKQPHHGLHGVFGDCLPDGWGLLLQDRVLRQHGILPTQVTAMDRLAFVGHRGTGALAFSPLSPYSDQGITGLDIASLGLEAQALFDQSVLATANHHLLQEGTQRAQGVLAALAAGGNSGGARPKAQIYIPSGDTKQARLNAEPGDQAWLVKFTPSSLALGHEEGLCEAVYLQMASDAKCQPPTWQLMDAPARSGALAWLAVKRFDYISSESSAGRLHMHSACGLLDADFRIPSLDYEDLIKATRRLCKSPSASQLQFRRAVFNLLAANQDDHSKNWAFLQTDDGQWQPAPFYDVTYSPHPFNEHATAFGGHGKAPPIEVMQKLAASAGFGNWQQAKQCIQEVAQAIAQFSDLAKQQGISNITVSAIEKTLAQRRKENAALLR